MQENLGSNYSKIISPQDYNTLMTEQHLYIKAADNYIAKMINSKINSISSPEVVEIGCGPARITKMIFEKNNNINLSGIDADAEFINFARNTCEELPIKFINDNIFSYEHKKEVDIFYSQGFHHHISKNDDLTIYLSSIYKQLKKGGEYIVGDEFISEYYNDFERDINLVLWYCHIISNALYKNYDFLAQEEAKTLLDDIYSGHTQAGFKTDTQIELVLEFSPRIDKLCKKRNKEDAKLEAKNFLEKLKALYTVTLNDKLEMDLSRGDFKISPSVFKEEVRNAGFIIKDSKFFGPASQIGAMGVYSLLKL